MLVIRDGRIRDYVDSRKRAASDKLSIVVTLLKMDDLHIRNVSSQDKVSEEDVSNLLKALISKDVPVLNFEIKKKSLQKAYLDIAVQDNSELELEKKL